MRIAILAFERLTALDAVGPYEVLAKLPDAEVSWVSLERGLVRADGGLSLHVDRVLEDVPDPELLLIPGGYGVRALAQNERVLRWLRKAHASTRFTCSVCTGAMVLGAAGLLNDIDATTHWARRELIERYGARYVEERVVFRDRIVTAAGVSSGIDMALLLTQRLFGDELAQAIQLGIEYDPQPPFDVGSAHKAPRQLQDLVRSRLDAAH
jgi:transcriptional regulator GlxA family with amidase domain